MEERESGIETLVGGDFNTRIGREKGEVEEEERINKGERREGKQSKDGRVNGESRKLIVCKGNGWSIFQRRYKGR